MTAIVLAFLIAMVPSSDQLDRCRSLYFSLDQKDGAETFAVYCGSLDGHTPILLAYKGCAQTVIAGDRFNPLTRYSLFTEGKEMIERAIKLAPHEAEIRMLRLGIQLNAPGFLGYNHNIDEDVHLILEALGKGWLNDHPDFKEQVITFLRVQAPLSESQKERLSTTE